MSVYIPENIGTFRGVDFVLGTVKVKHCGVGVWSYSVVGMGRVNANRIHPTIVFQTFYYSTKKEKEKAEKEALALATLLNS